jgi:hypothetical protein
VVVAEEVKLVVEVVLVVWLFHIVILVLQELL